MIGSFFDYICFRDSNIGAFNIGSSSFNFNIFSFYGSLVLGVVFVCFYLGRKWKVI
jgi:hypothetical protein